MLVHLQDLLAYEANFKGEVRHDAWLWLVRRHFRAPVRRTRVFLHGPSGELSL
jgi:hypothetical protein